MAKTVESEERKSRRDVLKALSAAAAGAVAGGVLSAKEAQADHGTLNATSSTQFNPAIHGENTGFGAGVFGGSDQGFGVEGRSSFGIGVLGFSDSGSGVFASTTSGTALNVHGRAEFSTASSGTILANQDSASVSNVAVTASSHITVTLTGDPGQAGSAPGFKPVVVWVERQPGTGFVVHMARPVRVDTPFTYLIVEPGF